MTFLIIPKVGWAILNIFMFGLLVIFLVFLIFIYKTLLKKDLFGYTHYPIRFNRQNRKVYVFKSKDNIKIFDWASLEVAITRIDTGDRRKSEFDIRFTQLAEDGMVVDTFCLPFKMFVDTVEYTEQEGYQFSSDVEAVLFASNWEYIRCYMEEDIEISYQAVRGLVPLDKKRESLLQSMKMAWYYTFKMYSFREVETENGEKYLVDIQKSYNDMNLANLFKSLFFFIVVIFFIGRLFVMNIAKRPKWSKAVEEACVVDLNDRYNYEKFPNQGHPKARETAFVFTMKVITFFLCYLSIYGFLWLFDTVAAARGSGFSVRFSDYLAFWHWF